MLSALTGIFKAKADQNVQAPQQGNSPAGEDARAELPPEALDEILAATAPPLDPLPSFHDPKTPGLTRPRIGLALGAGVARGWAHIGVVRKLQQMGIPIDMIAGTSIGAVVGGALASNSLDVLEDWAKSLNETSFLRLVNLRFGTGGGLFGSDRFNNLIKERYKDQRFEDLDIPFVAVACELKTGHEIWLKHGDLASAIQASFALPGVFEPQQIEDRWLVDGALVNPVPASVCRAAGCDLVIAVNLAEDLYGQSRADRQGVIGTGEFGVFKEIAESPSAEGRGRGMGFLRDILRQKDKGPSMFANMVASLNILQNRLSRSRLAGDPPDVTISPRVGHIGLMEFHRTEELIREGELAFEDERPQLEDALSIVTHRMNS